MTVIGDDQPAAGRPEQELDLIQKCAKHIWGCAKGVLDADVVFVAT